MRKPYPIKMVDEQDERLSIRDDTLEIEFAGKRMTAARARIVSSWLSDAAFWCETEADVRKVERAKAKDRAERKPAPHKSMVHLILDENSDKTACGIYIHEEMLISLDKQFVECNRCLNSKKIED